MSTHDIELPGLPPLHIAPSVEPVDYPEVAQALMDYARAAVAADRKRRGEPVAWRYKTSTGWHATTDAAKALRVADHHAIEPLYSAPQPAEPVKLQCPKCGADRSKVPCAGELMNCHFKGEAQSAEPVKVPSEDERAAQGLPPYKPRHPTEEEWNRLTENGRRAWGKQPAVPEKEPPCDT